MFSIIVGLTVSLNVFYIVYKGAKGIDLDEIPISVACYWSFGMGLCLHWCQFYQSDIIKEKF